MHLPLAQLYRYQVSYHCLFDLRLFPFDQQECIMQFRMRSATNKRVVFKTGTLEYFGHRSMVEFLLETIAIQDGLRFYFAYLMKLYYRLEKKCFLLKRCDSFLIIFLNNNNRRCKCYKKWGWSLHQIIQTISLSCDTEFFSILVARFLGLFDILGWLRGFQWQVNTRGWCKIICTNTFNCSDSNTHSTRLGHAKKLFIRKFPLKWGIVRFCRSYITRDMGQNVFSRFYEFFKNLRKNS